MRDYRIYYRIMLVSLSFTNPKITTCQEINESDILLTNVRMANVQNRFSEVEPNCSIYFSILFYVLIIK